MKENPRRALDALVNALERHLEVALSLEGDAQDSEVLIDAENRLRDAFFTYDDTLFTQTGVEMPFDILDDDEDDSEADDEFDDEDDSGYLGGEDFEDFDLTED